jgi:hypothetical protein
MAEKDNKLVQDAVVLVAETDDELSQTIDVEKLGRQRPAAFSSAWMEIAFVVSILGSLSMAVGHLSSTNAGETSHIPQFTGNLHMSCDLLQPYTRSTEELISASFI